jgi:copper chaperone
VSDVILQCTFNKLKTLKYNVMETMKFKTTIKCSGCIEKATPVLDEKVGKDKWQVDTQNPDKILTVVKDEHLNEGDVINAVQQAGFKAEKLN